MKHCLFFSIITCFILLLAGTSHAQNLIPNGDFELGPDSSSAGWTDAVDSGCISIGNMSGPDSWMVTSGTPDRIVDGASAFCWTYIEGYDTAASGIAAIMLASGEGGKATLNTPIQKDSVYELSYYAYCATGASWTNSPQRFIVHFNNNQDSILSPYIYAPQSWQYFDTIFVAQANATEIELNEYYDGTTGACFIDNVSLTKVSNNSIVNYFSFVSYVNIYPNPSEGMVHIRSSEKITRLELYNELGHRIVIDHHLQKTSGTSMILNLHSLPVGIYFIQVKTLKQSIIKKVVLIN